MTTLPPVDDVLNLPHEINAKSLYTIILKAEYAAETTSLAKELMCSRVLGYLVLHPLGNVARDYVLKEIASHNERYGNSDEELNNALYELGEHYVHHLLGLFRKSGGRTPAPSSHVSPSSLQRTPRNHISAKAQALVRDNYRCMVTATVDYRSYTVLPDLHRICVQKSLATATTHCCHIFPQSTNDFPNGAGADEGSKKTCPATVWTILFQFGFQKLQDQLTGHLIHRLDNILTLHAQLHEMMDTLQLWFEEVVGEENTYTVQLGIDDPGHMRRLYNIPTKVKFVAHSDHPLPNPQYLFIHAACCRVAHLSGAAKYLDEIFLDMEELSVLAEDGASANSLVYALHQFVDPG